MSSLGDATSSLGDATSSLGDAKSSLGDAMSSLGDVKSSLSGMFPRSSPGAVPFRAVGKLFVVPAWALPVPVSDGYIGLYRAANRRIFSG
jgi:hypothetical protein